MQVLSMSQRQKTVLLVYTCFRAKQKKQSKWMKKHILTNPKKTPKKNKQKPPNKTGLLQQHHLATQTVYNRGQLNHIYCDVSSLSLLLVQNDNFILLTLLKAQHLMEVKVKKCYSTHTAQC